MANEDGNPEERLGAVAARLSVDVERVRSQSAWSVVADVRRGDERLVLKVAHPGVELDGELACLLHYAGAGAVRVVEADAEAGGLLLARVEPGTPLLELENDDEATVVAARLMQRLMRRPEGDVGLPATLKFTSALHRAPALIGGELAERAVVELEALLTSAPERVVVLHGDLHHANILRSTTHEPREPWLAIDPKGLLGEPAFECGAFIRNPPGLTDRPDLPSLLEHRIATFADELTLDPDRITRWALVQAVLAATWAQEDNDEAWRRHSMAVAVTVEALVS